MNQQLTGNKNRKFFIVLLCIALCIRLFAANGQFIEKYYATSSYSRISAFFRFLFGWIPFSMGDVLYITAVLYGVWKFAALIKYIRNKSIGAIFKREYLFGMLGKILMLYIIFNVLWGLNYDRSGIRSQMKLEQQEYSKEALEEINRLLIDKVNTCKTGSINQKIAYSMPADVFKKTYSIYREASLQYPFLQYKNQSIKSSFFGTLGNYLGFSGYYNPFTGEAQVNTTIPAFLQPFVCCHEVAHQLGYAKENEANFVGYIVATSCQDSLFMYSAYLDIFLYANRNLRRTDSISAREFSEQLSPAVKKDIQTMKDFYRNFQNPVEPYITWVYGKYLESNRQPSGMLSYSEVIGDIIAYYKKYGKIGGR
ncbi:MAG: DUF3810 domain-containing protein [Chitinophagaceae bacterium]|nr:DUF3810 domain-containing protein [Chitinophagaceae bacterium]